ncbi:MAG: glycosyltransferase [Sporichthyaceae bacterium]
MTTVSVVIAAHTEERWHELVRAVSSALGQTRRPLEVIVTIDHNPALLARVRDSVPGITAVLNEGSDGASGTRNAGAAVASGDVLAFLDDDAVADLDRLERLLPPLDQRDVVGVGGFVRPLWTGRAPRWFPPEFLWVVGASYRGLPEFGGVVRNVWSENMAVRRTDFVAVGGFREGFGKTGTVSRPEDTDLCIRLARDGRTWWYAPDARIGHSVPAGRSSPRFYLRRCWMEGRGKAQLASLLAGDAVVPTRADELRTERVHALRTLPRGVARELVNAARGDGWGAVRALAIVAGLLAAALGLVAERMVVGRPA